MVKVKVVNKQDSNGLSTEQPAAGQPTATPVQSGSTSSPTATAGATATAEPTAEPTEQPTAEPTADVYTTELFSMEIEETRAEAVEGSTCTVEMQMFEGTVTGDYFNGTTKKGASNSNVTKTFKEDEKVTNCARFILSGKDDMGEECEIYIQDDGVMSNSVLFTRPIIFTNSTSLKWIEKADIQGRVVTDADGSKSVRYLWNESGPEFILPEVVLPGYKGEDDVNIFQFNIGVGGSDTVKGDTGEAVMIHFTCSGDCEYFKGKGIEGMDFVDTRHKGPGRVETLSARYILEGTDKNGAPCRIYVENNGVDSGGMRTEPFIVTDSPAYAWIETAKLHGTTGGPGLTIYMWAAEVPED